MNAPRSARRTRAAAAALATTLVLTGAGIAAAASAQASPGFAFDTRVGGDTRTDTAIKVSKQLYPTDGTATDVVVVNGYRPVDGLTASYLAGLKNAPILFTDTDAMTQATKDEIHRLGVKDVWIVGGTAVVSQALEDSLKGTYTTHRYGGEDRYETAAKVATAGPYQPERVYVTSGYSLADAVVVGPISWAKNYPILLTDKDSTSHFTKDALAKLDVSERTAVGGQAVISEGVTKDLGITKRLAGDTRQGTAVAVADDAVATADFTGANAGLVGGLNLNAIDALAGSALAGATGTPLLYTEDANTLGEVTRKYLDGNGDQLNGEGFVFGGTSAITDGVVAAASAAAQ